MKRIKFLLIGFILLILGYSRYVFAGDGTIKGIVSPHYSNATVFVTSTGFFANYSITHIHGFGTINDDGEYSIPVIPGVYNLLFTADGYINKTLFQITVNEDAIVEASKIKLAKIGESGSISGYVNPIMPGLKVQIGKFGAGKVYSSTVSNDGYYEISGLEPDTYSIFVRFNSSSDFYDYNGWILNVETNNSLSDINLKFTPKNSKYLIDRILVDFRLGITKTEEMDIINSYGSKVMEYHIFNGNSNYILSVPHGKTEKQMVDLFNENPKIQYASLDGIMSVRGIQIVENSTTKKSHESLVKKPPISSEPTKNTTKTNFSAIKEQSKSIFLSLGTVVYFIGLSLSIILIFVVFKLLCKKNE